LSLLILDHVEREGPKEEIAMYPVIDDLKHRARLLHKLAGRSEPGAIAELRSLDEFSSSTPEAIAQAVTRRHCLSAIAVQLGFDGWPHALDVLEGARLVNFGTLLVPPKSSPFWNVWSANYEEAARIRAKHGGYLLAYLRQFLVADADFIRHLGLDPDDPDWEAINRDWPNAANGEARARLYAKLTRQRLPMLEA